MLRAYRGQWPRVAATAFVDRSAQVIGDVEIGEAASVWMNVVIRGDVHRIRIGARTNIQDGTIVHVMRDTHPTTLGDDVTVGHAAVLDGEAARLRVVGGRRRRQIERRHGGFGGTAQQPAGDHPATPRSLSE